MRTLRIEKPQSVSLAALLFGIGAAGLSSILLVLTHSSWGSGWWALIALTPILVLSSKVRDQRYTVLIGSIASIGPSGLMFESISAGYPLAAFVAAASQAPQVILPLIVWSRLTATRPGLPPILAFSTVWILWEQIRMLPLLSGEFASFYSLAYSQVDTGLLLHAGSGAVTVSALIALSNAVLATNLINRRIFWSSPLLVLFVPSVLGNDLYSVQAQGNEATQIRVIQPAWTPSEQILMTGNHDHLVSYMEPLIAWVVQPDDDVIHSFLPETSIHNIESAERMQTLLQGRLHTIVAGMALAKEPWPSNSIIMVDEQQVTNLYNKWQLVPIYETPVFRAGNHLAIMQLADELAVGLLICMDGTIDWLVESTVRAGADAIVVLSASDYGRGYSTPELHLQLVRAQAVLHEVPIVFLASNGPSAFITPDGIIRKHLMEGQQGDLTINLERWQKDPSRQLWYRQAWNPVFAVLMAVLGVLLNRRE